MSNIYSSLNTNSYLFALDNLTDFFSPPVVKMLIFHLGDTFALALAWNPNFSRSLVLPMSGTIHNVDKITYSPLPIHC